MRMEKKFCQLMKKFLNQSHPAMNTLNFIEIRNICESKLDLTFPNEQFYINGFNTFRNDHTSLSGGLITWIRNDLPSS